jgi:hypothetical protein
MKPLCVQYSTMCYQALINMKLQPYVILSVIIIMITTIHAVHMAVFTVSDINFKHWCSTILYHLRYFKYLHVHRCSAHLALYQFHYQSVVSLKIYVFYTLLISYCEFW